MSENFLAGQASIWVQPDGPNTKPLYLGCHGVGDVTEPKGDKTLLYCPDPAQVGKYKIKNSFRGAPGAVTTTIDTDLRKTADYLEQLGLCGVPVYVHKVLSGRRDTFTNFGRTFIFYPAEVTSQSLSALAARKPDDEGESGQSFDMSADELIRGFNLQASRISVLATGDVTGIAVCGEERCEGVSTQAQKPNDYIYLATKPLAGSATKKADVLYSEKGSAFAATAGDPFANAAAIQGIVCFRIDVNTIRVIVARGTTDAGPLDIAYSDDKGVTWTSVAVGSTNAEFVANGHALFAFDRYHIWVGSNLGRIYFSEDGGETWRVQENAALSATAIQAISFVDPDAGFTLYAGGEVAKTSNGSNEDAVWSLATAVGVAGQTDFEAVTPFFLWAVGSNGRYYSHDGAVTWSKRDSIATAAIDFSGPLVSVTAGSAASALIKETVNGGYDWTSLPVITNGGFLDVLLVTPSLGYVAGKTSGGTGFVAMLQPQI